MGRLLNTLLVFVLLLSSGMYGSQSYANILKLESGHNVLVVNTKTGVTVGVDVQFETLAIQEGIQIEVVDTNNNIVVTFVSYSLYIPIEKGDLSGSYNVVVTTSSFCESVSINF